ncbi:MAG: effector binding domain-containing protein [Spirochaetes bacterium]|nr:effector binding domain-containing protein [Spirochaetota bacterium]
MNYERTWEFKKEITGIATPLTRSQKENYQIIRKHWKNFNRQLGINQVNTGANWKKYGVTYRRDNTYFYFTGLPLAKEINGFEKLSIETGYYIKFRHSGSMPEIKNTVYQIYKKIIPENGIDLDDQRRIIHYEYYDCRFKWNDKDSIIDIFVPIKMK